MRLTYETGIATFIQFIVLGFLNIIDQVYSIITTCIHSNKSDCVTNALASVVFYLLIVGWFGIIMAVGYAAQSKRTKRLCLILIGLELLVMLFAIYNIKLDLNYNKGFMSLFTSFLDLVLSGWVVVLSLRLMKAGGGRVVHHRRVRHHSSEL